MIWRGKHPYFWVDTQLKFQPPKAGFFDLPTSEKNIDEIQEVHEGFVNVCERLAALEVKSLEAAWKLGSQRRFTGFDETLKWWGFCCGKRRFKRRILKGLKC